MKSKAAVLLLTLLCVCSLGYAQNNDLSTGQQSLAGTSWRLVSMGRVGAESPTLRDPAASLRFGSDGRVTGSGGCNTYGGGYRVQGDRITFTQVFSTRRACVDSNANRQESDYLQALSSANKFRLGSQSLTIYYDRGRSILEFADADASQSSNEGPLNDVEDPVSALIAYYRAIDAKDYRRAYRYWESPVQTFQQFNRGFADTVSVRLLVDPSPQIEGAAGSSYANVSTFVISSRAGGEERLFAGCYVMRKSNLGAEDGQARQGWRIYRADVQAVAPNARASNVLSRRCTQ